MNPEALGSIGVEEEITAHEVEREEIFERLERRTNLVLALKEVTEKSTVDQPVEEFDAAIDAVFTEARALTVDDSQQRFAAAEKLFQERLNLFRQLIAQEDEGLREVREKESQLNEKQEALLQDDGARFLWNMSRTVSSLKYKHFAVQHFAGHPDQLAETLKLHLKKDIDLNRIDEIHWTGTQGVFFLQSGYYDELLEQPGSAGLHIGRTPWSFVRRTDDAFERLIERHETVHNVVDGAPDIRSHPTGPVAHYRERYLGATSIVTKEELDQDFSSLKTSAVDYLLDRFQDELLAGLEQAEQQTFPAVSPNDADRASYVSTFFHYIDKYSTAGAEAGELSGILSDLVMKARQEGSQSEIPLRNLSLDFIRRFGETVETIRTSVERAQKLGPDVNDRVHAMMTVLPPSKYRHISRYLDHLEAEQAA